MLLAISQTATGTGISLTTRTSGTSVQGPAGNIPAVPCPALTPRCVKTPALRAWPAGAPHQGPMRPGMALPVRPRNSDPAADVKRTGGPDDWALASDFRLAGHKSDRRS